MWVKKGRQPRRAPEVNGVMDRSVRRVRGKAEKGKRRGMKNLSIPAKKRVEGKKRGGGGREGEHRHREKQWSGKQRSLRRGSRATNIEKKRGFTNFSGIGNKVSKPMTGEYLSEYTEKTG